MSLAAGRYLVTGASSGIGRAVAEAVADAGGGEVRLELLGRDADRLADAAAAVRERGAEAATHAFDLLDDAALADFVASAFPDGAALAALVHSAGVARVGSFAEADLDDLDLQYRLNLRAPYALTQWLLPALRRGRGSVVFVNSGAGLRARAGWAQYAASKHGLRALADSLRDEFSGAGLRVVSVYPGRVATPMQEAVRAMEGAPYDPDDYVAPADVAAQVRAALELPPGAVVTDVSVRPA